MSRQPPIFEAQHIEAHGDDARVTMEIVTAGNCAFIFRCDPEHALTLAHQIERAYHQMAHAPLARMPATALEG